MTWSSTSDQLFKASLKTSPPRKETCSLSASKTKLGPRELPSGLLAQSNKTQNIPSSTMLWDRTKPKSRESSHHNAKQLFLFVKTNASKLLPPMRLRHFSKKWSETTTGTLLNALKVMLLKNSRMVLSNTTTRPTTTAKLWTHAILSDLVLLLTSPSSITKWWVTKSKLSSLERTHFQKPSRKSTMLMRRHSEMPNQSLNFLRRICLSGKKKKSKTTSKTCEQTELDLQLSRKNCWFLIADIKFVYLN